MFDKILFCSDNSEGALTAARLCAQVALNFHSVVLLIHAYDPDFTTYPPYEADAWELAVRQDGMDPCAEEVRLTLEEHTGRIFTKAGVHFEALLERGHPVEAITRAAKQHGADLIVVGSRGLSDVETFLMGSVAEEVLHHAHCPVLIVRGDHAPQKAPVWKHILLASDGSAGALQATDVAVEVARTFEASLSVLNVLDASSLGYKLSPYLPVDSDTPYTCAEHLLAEITKDVSQKAHEAHVPRTFHQETGYPAETIIAFASRTDADLIVIGCRGLGTFKSLLLGSISNRVAHHSRLSVLVTR